MSRKGTKLPQEQKDKMKAGRKAYWDKVRAQKSMEPVYAPSETQPTVKLSKDVIQNAREDIVKKIFKGSKKILEAQIDSAQGLYYTTPDGKHVYTSKPDRSAGEYLLNQLIGKPKESIEIKNINLNVDL